MQPFVDGLPKGSCPTLCYCSRSVPNGSAAPTADAELCGDTGLTAVVRARATLPPRHLSFTNRPSFGFRRMTSTASDGRREVGTKRSHPRGCRTPLDLDGHGCPGAFWGAAAEAAHECPGADRVQEGRVRSRKRQRAPRLARAWAFVRALAADPRRRRPRRRDHLRDRRQRVVRTGCVEVK
jgi:hypothetical protein